MQQGKFNILIKAREGGIYRDKTMSDTWIYIPNDDTQKEGRGWGIAGGRADISLQHVLLY